MKNDLLFSREDILASKKKMLVWVLCLFAAYASKAQPIFMEQHTVDSLHKIIALNKQDTTEVHAYYTLSRGNTLSNTTQSVDFGNKGLALARQIKFPMGELECLEALSFSYAI